MAIKNYRKTQMDLKGTQETSKYTGRRSMAENHKRLHQSNENTDLETGEITSRKQMLQGNKNSNYAPKPKKRCPMNARKSNKTTKQANT